MAEIALEGSRVSSDKLTESGFQFTFRKIESVLNNLI